MKRDKKEFYSHINKNFEKSNIGEKYVGYKFKKNMNF